MDLTGALPRDKDLTYCDEPHPDDPDVQCLREQEVGTLHKGLHCVPGTQIFWGQPTLLSKEERGKVKGAVMEGIDNDPATPPPTSAEVLPVRPGLAAEIAAGIATADANANPDWKRDALEAVRWCAEHHERFVVANVWDRLDALAGPTTHNPAAMGPILLKAVNHGWIKNSDEVQMVQETGHRKNYVVIWQSLIYARESVAVAGLRDFG